MLDVRLGLRVSGQGGRLLGLVVRCWAHRVRCH